MNANVDTAVHRLVVTGAGRDRLYQRFTRLFRGRDGVEVVKDRRVTERRRGSSQSAVERRSRERRRAWRLRGARGAMDGAGVQHQGQLGSVGIASIGPSCPLMVT